MISPAVALRNLARSTRRSESLDEMSERRTMQDFLRMEIFFRDLISYSMMTQESSYEVSRLRIQEYSLYQRHKRFYPEIGDAVLLYRQLYRRRIVQDMSALLNQGLTEELITNCILQTADHLFKEEHFLGEFIAFCAYFVDLSLFLVSNEHAFFLDDVFNTIEILYRDRFARRFSTHNVWNELHRLAVRRLIYGTH